jgi:hypothetical protein
MRASDTAKTKDIAILILGDDIVRHAALSEE